MKSYSLPLAIIAASTVFATQSAFANPVVLDFETDGGEVDGGGVGVEWDVRACTTFEADYGRLKRLCPDQELPR